MRQYVHTLRTLSTGQIPCTQVTTRAAVCRSDDRSDDDEIEELYADPSVPARGRGTSENANSTTKVRTIAKKAKDRGGTNKLATSLKKTMFYATASRAYF